ncbi:hypothetical protein [Escherichia phage vB_EcoM_JNE01]|nr:hypothetical protein [Escherichia phage vB_EcoM_JNE01]
MNLNVSKEFFDDVKESFLQLNENSRLDPEIKEVVLRWQKSPLLDKIVPRWSCQGHSDTHSDSDYYIIFCTQDDGADILYDIFDEFCSLEHNCAGWNYSVIKLIHQNHKKAEPHIEIGRYSEGHQETINYMKALWLAKLQEIEDNHEQYK